MEFDLIVQAISTLGFPIAMVGYFIWDKVKTTERLENIIETNTKALTELTTIFKYYVDKHEEEEKE